MGHELFSGLASILLWAIARPVRELVGILPWGMGCPFCDVVGSLPWAIWPLAMDPKPGLGNCVGHGPIMVLGPDPGPWFKVYDHGPRMAKSRPGHKSKDKSWPGPSAGCEYTQHLVDFIYVFLPLLGLGKSGNNINKVVYISAGG